MGFVAAAEDIVFKVRIRLPGTATMDEEFEVRRRLRDLLQSEWPGAQVDGILYRLPLSKEDIEHGT